LYHLDDPYIVYLDGKNVGTLKREQSGYHILEMDSISTELFNGKDIKVSNSEGIVLEGKFI
jgi:hypothetical protein